MLVTEPCIRDIENGKVCIRMLHAGLFRVAVTILNDPAADPYTTDYEVYDTKVRLTGPEPCVLERGEEELLIGDFYASLTNPYHPFPVFAFSVDEQYWEEPSYCVINHPSNDHYQIQFVLPGNYRVTAQVKEYPETADHMVLHIDYKPHFRVDQKASSLPPAVKNRTIMENTIRFFSDSTCT